MWGEMASIQQREEETNLVRDHQGMGAATLSGIRVLVTGSRNWSDDGTVEQALREYAAPENVLVHGGCPTGADKIADRYWQSLALPVEVYPAEWQKYGKSAGQVRNQAMVNSKPDIVLGFLVAGSRGTADCLRRARGADLTVRVIQPGKGGE